MQCAPIVHDEHIARLQQNSSLDRLVCCDLQAILHKVSPAETVQMMCMLDACAS